MSSITLAHQIEIVTDTIDSRFESEIPVQTTLAILGSLKRLQAIEAQDLSGEREAFELAYAQKWRVESPMAAGHTIEFLCGKLKEMRQGGGYGNGRDYLNFKLEGWIERAALNKPAMLSAAQENK